MCWDGCPATSRELALLPGLPPSRPAWAQCPRLTDSTLGAAQSREQRGWQQWPGLPGPRSSWGLCPGMQWDAGEGESPSPQSGVFLPVFSQGRSWRARSGLSLTRLPLGALSGVEGCAGPSLSTQGYNGNSIRSSRFVCVVGCVKISFLFKAE